MAEMNKWERGIREKVFERAGLSEGEWVYLVGLFHMANDESLPAQVASIEAENERFRAALTDIATLKVTGGAAANRAEQALEQIAVRK